MGYVGRPGIDPEWGWPWAADAMGRKLAMSSESVLSIGDGSGYEWGWPWAQRCVMRSGFLLCIEFGMKVLDLLVPHKRNLAIF